MNLHNVEYELNKMRAESLGEAGKKLEALNEMIQKEKAYHARLLKIQTRLEELITGSRKKKKRNIAKRLLERLPGKLDRSASYLRQMAKHKEQLYKNVILQREALGVTDHSWIDKFYMEEK